MTQGQMRRSRHALVAAVCAVLVTPAAAQATFPGTPGQILYSCGAVDGDGPSRVCVVGPDGSGNRRLVEDASNPTWSPDGVHYAYVKAAPSELPGANAAERIHISNINGGSAVRRLEPESRASNPAWAPDGLRLAFVDDGRGAGDSADIWITDLDDRRRNVTTGTVGVDSEPDWSPDGRRIAFSSNREDGRQEIYTVDVDSGAITRITRSGERGSSASPSWSPDGASIAFVRDQTNEDGARASDLWVVRADGSGERPVTNHFGAGEFNVHVFEPAWSPDGARIAFRRDTESSSGSLRVINADGSGDTPLGVTGYEPDWGPAAGSGSVQPLAAPQLSRVKLARRAIWTAPPVDVRPTSRDGTPLSFQMNGDGYIRIGVQRISRGRPRGRPVVTATIRARAGSSRVRWLGVYSNGFDVPRGTYRLVLVPFNPLGDVGRTANSPRFRVLGSCLERRSRPCRAR